MNQLPFLCVENPSLWVFKLAFAEAWFIKTNCLNSKQIMSVPSDFALDILMMEMFSFLLGGNILLESQLKAISFQSALLT